METIYFGQTTSGRFPTLPVLSESG